MKKIAIVGAGPGGLAAGLLLASKGHSVTIYEKDNVIGGRSKRLKVGDYMFSHGPSFIVYLSAFRKLFEKAGLNFDALVPMKRLDPIYELNTPNHPWQLSGDFETLVKQVEDKFGEGDAYRAFMERETIIFEAMQEVMYRPFNKTTDLLQGNMAEFGKYVGLSSIRKKIKKRFKAPLLKDSMQFQSKYLGMTPDETPGFFTILSYLEHVEGIYHIEGGVPALLDVMAEEFKKMGGEIKTAHAVDKVITEGGKATGLIVKGKPVKADIVVVNADVPTMVETLIPSENQKKYTPKKMAKKGYSVSAYMLYLGLKEKLDWPVHTLLLSSDYDGYTKDLKKNKILSDDMSMYLYHPSVIDDSFAPEGHSSLMVLVPVPNTASGINWDLEEDAYKTKIYKRLQERLGFDVSQIAVEKPFTPVDWEKTGVYRGATFALKHTLLQLLHFRPHNAYQDVDDLYLVGGSTHPGSGLPIIFQSAIISAELIEKKIPINH